jgi:hypothetical protein
MGRNLTFPMQIVQDSKTSFKQGLNCLDNSQYEYSLHITDHVANSEVINLFLNRINGYRSTRRGCEIVETTFVCFKNPPF